VINSQPLFEDNSPVPVSVVSSIIDVTRERKLENEVLHQRALFDTFQNNTPHLSWMVDEDANLLYANASFFKHLNLEKNAIGKNILSLVPKEIAIALENKHKQVLKTGSPQRAQEKMFLADGTRLVFWINLFPVQSINGNNIIGGEAINITERFKAEERLQQVNERLKYLSHITTDAIWEWNLQTGQIIRNHVLKQITGFTFNNTQSLGWWFRRVHPNDRRKLHRAIKNVVETKQQSWESEYRFKKASGEYLNVLDRGYVIYENDQPVKMIGSLHDITELKELEAKLVEEKICHQKTITETIFAVQEQERTRMGHELHDNVNQILSTCKLYTEMVNPATAEDQNLKSKVIEYILAAIEEIRRLSKEMVTPQLRENGLVASVTSLVEDLKVTHALNVLFYHQDAIEVLSSGKKVALFRIIQEQVKNTLKYSQANNLTIHLNADDDNATMIIEDDGIGFDPKQTHRGIGLSNIYERTKFYDGDVTIKAAPGKGCKVIVKMPI
jgi:PAS domain S-box-containing protein